MAHSNSYYPAKLLLFGEYTVLNGSQALAVPLNRWHGTWVKEKIRQRSYFDGLSKYVTWLKKKEIINQDTEGKIISDFEEGWNYESNIPQGYGVGSSGALVAAVYDRYFTPSKDLAEIHSTMAQMEAYYHGASSGLDPLISYTNKAAFKDEDGHYHSVNDKGWPDGYKIYLLDSGHSRETGPLVTKYKKQLQDPGFSEKIKRQFIPMVEHAIHFYLGRESKMLEECFSVISQFQKEYFTDMIPAHVQKQWDELASVPGVYVKLCGAGGGGYFLVISTKPEEDFDQQELIRLN